MVKINNGECSTSVDASSFSLLYYLIYITHLFIISFEKTGGVKTPTGYIFNNKKEGVLTTKAQETKKRDKKLSEITKGCLSILASCQSEHFLP